MLKIVLICCFVFVIFVELDIVYCADDSPCSTNETYLEYGPNCEPTCSNPLRTCDTFDILIYPGGCYCLDNYARNSTDSCVLRNDCALVCGKHEISDQCGRGCDISCNSTVSLCNPSNTDLCYPGCYCDSGYARMSRSGKCVAQSRCIILS